MRFGFEFPNPQKHDYSTHERFCAVEIAAEDASRSKL